MFSFPEMELMSDSGVDKELKVVLTDYKQEVSHVCLCVCLSVQVITFEPLHIETSIPPAYAGR